MSDIYVRRLDAVRREYDVAASALRYTVSNWHREEISAHFLPHRLQNIRDTETNLEATYFLRLTAEFEGLLKEHLRQNHPIVKFPARKADWKLDWFLSRVCQREELIIAPELRDFIDRSREYRNLLAHGDTPAARVRLNQALKAYTVFVGRLLEPFD